MIDREAAYQALADRIRDGLDGVLLDGGRYPSAGWTVSRVYRDFSDPKLPQPACCVVASSQAPTAYGPGNTRAWALRADAVVYFQNRDPDAVVDTMINQVIDAVDACLAVKPAEADQNAASFFTTLGGVVVAAKIEGEIQLYPGLPEGQTVVVIPITMLAA